MVAGEQGEDAVEARDLVDGEGEGDELGGGAEGDEVEEGLGGEPVRNSYLVCKTRWVCRYGGVLL